MHREEALSLVRSCVINFLGETNESNHLPYIELRAKLETETLHAEEDLERLAAYAYCVLRTTLTILLTNLKVAKGAKLERAAENISVLLPILWPKLRDRDRFQTGETFSALHASVHDRLAAITSLQNALLRVNGSDFVRDTFSSESYRRAARAVLGAHLGWDNLDGEPKPMEDLAWRGASIPNPALGDCFTAALCVRLGNRYGHSQDAQPAAGRYLKLLGPPQWEYYLNKVLTGDRHILEKLAYDDKPLERWQELVAEFKLADLTVDSRIAKMLTASHAKRAQIKRNAAGYRERIMQEA
jgi:hypothetical protein